MKKTYSMLSAAVLCGVSLVSLSANTDTRRVGVLVQKGGVVELMSVRSDSAACQSLAGDITVLGRPRRAHVANAVLREYMGVDFILPGIAHKPDVIPYTGKGVVLGIIDCGIDPNHITFRDTYGNTRVRRYIFTQSSEESADGNFHADIYVSPEEIAASPPDTSEGGHGTHTTATAAGSWRGNPYFGVAPDMEMVLVGTGSAIYDDEIIYGMNAASDYALSVGKPAVISLSLGSGRGPRDGTSPIGLVSAEIAAKGHHIFFAAGNDGKRGASIHRNFSIDTMAVRSMFQKYHRGSGHVCPLEAWSSDDKEAELQVLLCHRDTVKYASRWFTAADALRAGGRLTLLSDSVGNELLTELRQWLKGEIFAELGIYKPNGRFRIILDAVIDKYVHGNSVPYFAFGIRSPQGADMRIYADPYYNSLVSWENPEFMYGNASDNISDFAASPDVVSVGMVNATESVTSLSGKTSTLSSMGFGELYAPNLYSSRGTTLSGEVLPLVMAPGSLVISALYPEAPGMEANYVCDTVVEGRRYVWGHDSGTSMATPATAGTVALWLEAVPTLTPQQIRDVLRHSSNPEIRRNYPDHCAYGTVDAYAGLKYAIKTYSGIEGVRPDAPQKLSLRYLDGNASPGSRIEGLVPQPLADAQATFFDMQGKCVSAIPFSGTEFTALLPQTPGIYVLRVGASGFVASLKIAVR